MLINLMGQEILSQYIHMSNHRIVYFKCVKFCHLYLNLKDHLHNPNSLANRQAKPKESN